MLKAHHIVSAAEQASIHVYYCCNCYYHGVKVIHLEKKMSKMSSFLKIKATAKA